MNKLNIHPNNISDDAIEHTVMLVPCAILIMMPGSVVSLGFGAKPPPSKLSASAQLRLSFAELKVAVVKLRV